MIEWFGDSVTDATARRVADAILNDHAHELAEKIRSETLSLKAAGVLEPEKDWAASSAADLIDPEVAP